MALDKHMDRSWFHPNINAVEADQLLMTEGKLGSFLVRMSQTTEGSFSLSVRLADSVSHVKINNDGEGFDLVGLAGGDKFGTLSDLIYYYMNGLGQRTLKEKDGSVIELKFPLPTSDHSTERFFHRDITGANAEELLNAGKLPPGTFLVRKSQTQPNKFVLSVKTDSQKVQVLHIVINFKDKLYDIGDGNKFRSLVELVNFYRSNTMTDKSGIQIMLRQAVDKTHLKASEIDFRVAHLDREYTSFGVRRNGFWEEFEHLQNQENSHSYSRAFGEKPENKRKNRFKNILPYDHTRVILRDGDPKVPESDYVNANHLLVDDASMPDGTRKYIACQGCLQHTVADFWRLIVQERCTVIVMITKLVEDGKNKCFQYWPSVDEGSKSFNVYQGTITVTLDGTENYANFVRRTLTVEMKIEKGKMKGRENVSWTVYQYHFMEWMDKRIPTPERTDSILSFIGDINNQWKENNYAGPLVVHCSAGIGRTGTFIVIDCVLNQIKKRGLECDIDIAKTITSLRSQRSGLVQTDLQYKFIYLAIKRYIELERCPAAKSSNDNKDLYENIPASAFGSAGVGRGIAPPTAVKPQKAVSKQQVAQQLVAAVATKSRVKQPNDAAGDRQPVPADAAAVQGLVYENLDTVRLTAAGRVGTVRRQP